MDYWKAPVKYLLKTLAALAAYFLLAWALPNEECKVNGSIIIYPQSLLNHSPGSPSYSLC